MKKETSDICLRSPKGFINLLLKALFNAIIDSTDETKPFKLRQKKVYVTSFIITNSFGCIITCCNG